MYMYAYKRMHLTKTVLTRRFTDKPRYYNLLLSAWEQRYSGISREAGRLVLEQLCRTKHHLKVSICQGDLCDLIIMIVFSGPGNNLRQEDSCRPTSHRHLWPGGPGSQGGGGGPRQLR